MPSAECHTDHRLVRCKLNLQFKPKPKKSGPRGKKVNDSDLPSAEVKAKFKAGLQHKLEKSTCTNVPSPEALWDQLKTAILETSVDVLGHALVAH